jgi:hypothetical protein
MAMQHSEKCPRFVMRLVILLSLAAGVAICAGVRPGWAQSSGGINVPNPSNPSTLIGRPTSPLAAPPAGAKPAAAPPPSLPGAVTQSDRVSPAKGTVIADPNEALFDAINRGDIASARDALDRGADLEAHNVLGMTPIDLSVDLGRNDITFLLLSLRNGDLQLTHRGAALTAAAQAAPGGKPAPAGTKPPTAGTKQAARAAATPPVKQAAQTAPAAPVTPRLFAGDGGTPNPSVGFLGFGNRP